MRCADLEGRHLELECVRDEAAVGFSCRCFSNETNNGTNGNGLRVTVLDINVKTVNAMGLIEVVDLMSDGNDGDYDPLSDDVGYDSNDSDYQINGDLDWAAKKKKTIMKKGKSKRGARHKSGPTNVFKCGKEKKICYQKA